VITPETLAATTPPPTVSSLSDSQKKEPLSKPSSKTVLLPKTDKRATVKERASTTSGVLSTSSSKSSKHKTKDKDKDKSKDKKDANADATNDKAEKADSEKESETQQQHQPTPRAGMSSLGGSHGPAPHLGECLLSIVSLLSLE